MQASIDAALVRSLVADQFPRWAALPVAPMPHSGWDNRTFRLGDELLVRMPSSAAYAGQVAREQTWLPVLGAQLPFEIPVPLAMGRPGRGFPFFWSIYQFIPGERVSGENGVDLERLAEDLGLFLHALHRIDTAGGPEPGAHNFQRGGPLPHYDAQARQAIAALGTRIDAHRALETWEAALVSSWSRPAVWVHGDVAPANLLVREGRLAAVIDFGNLGVGDPACDLSIGWTLFSGSSRAAFRRSLPLDVATWDRARGWALWKALIVAAGHAQTNAPELARPFDVIEAVLAAQP